MGLGALGMSMPAAAFAQAADADPSARYYPAKRNDKYGDPLGRTVRDGIPFGDVVATHFRLAATATVGDRAFELYQRRE